MFPTRELIGKWAMSLPKEHHALAKTFKRLIRAEILEFGDDKEEDAHCEVCDMAEDLQKCRCTNCPNDFSLNMLQEQEDGSLEMAWVGFYVVDYCRKAPDGYLIDVDDMPWS